MGRSKPKHLVRISIDGHEKLVTVDRDEFVIGRDEASDVCIAHSEVSRRHLSVRIQGDKVMIKDLASAMGSTLKGRPLRPFQEAACEPTGEPVWLTRGIAISITPQPVQDVQIDSYSGILKEQANLEAQELKRRVLLEVEAVQTEAVRVCDLYKQEAQQDAETIREEAKQMAERTRRDAKNEANAIREDILSGIDRVKTDVANASSERERLQAECRAEADRLAAIRLEVEMALRKGEESKAELSDVKNQKAALSQEIEKYGATLSTIKSEIARSEKKEVDTKHLIVDLEEAHEKANQEFDGLNQRLLSLRGEIEEENALFRQIQESRKREQDLHGSEQRKRNAMMEALDAEYRVKRLALEGAIGEIDLKRIEAEHVLQGCIGKQHKAEEETAAQKRQNQRLIEEFNHTESEIQRVKLEFSEKERALEDFKKTTEQAALSARDAQEKLHLMEQEAVAARERLDLETNLAKQTCRADLERDASARKQELENEMVGKARRMEQELAQVRLKEMEKINCMVEEERRMATGRTKFLVEEITRNVIDLSRRKSLQDTESEVLHLVKSALEGKTTATTSAKAEERTRRFWKVFAVRASAPAALLLIYALFPNIPSLISEKFSQSVAAHQKEDGGAFLEEIQQRSAKYQPEMDGNYRNNYADNILYLNGYTEMKLDEKEQNSWTLTLNDFITGRLGLSDQVVADFGASEVVLLKELIKIREGILPQFKEQGFTRMAETEKLESAKMLTILQTPENYGKFRDLEKSYYEDYIKRKGSALRTPASTAPDATASVETSNPVPKPE